MHLKWYCVAHNAVDRQHDIHIHAHKAAAVSEDNIDEYSQAEIFQICQKAAAANYYYRIFWKICILDTFR